MNSYAEVRKPRDKDECSDYPRTIASKSIVTFVGNNEESQEEQPGS
jgi:hypothetical protein